MANPTFFMTIHIDARMTNLVYKYGNFLTKNKMRRICYARQLNLPSLTNKTCLKNVHFAMPRNPTFAGYPGPQEIV